MANFASEEKNLGDGREEEKVEMTGASGLIQ